MLETICAKFKNIEIPQLIANLLTNLSSEFYRTSHFPNCCGAINGKHIVCATDSMYFNYKISFFEVVTNIKAQNKKIGLIYFKNSK